LGAKKILVKTEVLWTLEDSVPDFILPLSISVKFCYVWLTFYPEDGSIRFL
jgi:hypothetical protein